MKLFLVAPVIPLGLDEAAIDARLQACIEPIAELVLAHLLDDPALFGMRHKTEGSASPLPMTSSFGYAEVVRLEDKAMLRAALMECGDPSSGKWMLIRSFVTCRTVFYGNDGQAFVCLPHDVAPILTPELDLITVEDQSQMLLDTDWMDGLLSE